MSYRAAWLLMTVDGLAERGATGWPADLNPYLFPDRWWTVAREYHGKNPSDWRNGGEEYAALMLVTSLGKFFRCGS